MTYTKLSQREEEILAYIYGYESDYGSVPHYSQIAEHFKIKSRAGVKYWIDRLIDKGLLKKLPIPHYVYYHVVNKNDL